MAITLVQSTGAAVSSTNSVTATLTTGTTKGNFIAAVYSSSSGTATGPHRWAKAITNTAVIQIWYLNNCAAGTTTYTFTNSSSANIVLLVGEFSGLDDLTVLDQTGTASSVTDDLNSSVSTDATTGKAVELIVCGVNVNAASENFTVGSGFSSMFLASSVAVASEWAASTTKSVKTATLSWDTAAHWEAAIATFTPATRIEPPSRTLQAVKRAGFF